MPINTKQKGFTLVETLVAITVFAILITIVGRVFVDALDRQRQALNTQQVLENVNYIMESVVKEVRVATEIDDCSDTCSDSQLHFQHPVNLDVRYALKGTNIVRYSNGDTTGQVINSNTVEFTRLQFYTTGNQLDDKVQPRITIVGSVRSTKTKDQATLDFQTTVSPRLIQD